MQGIQKLNDLALVTLACCGKTDSAIAAMLVILFVTFRLLQSSVVAHALLLCFETTQSATCAELRNITQSSHNRKNGNALAEKLNENSYLERWLLTRSDFTIMLL